MAVMLYDPWILCSVVRIMIRDTDSFRLSHNDCLDAAMRVRAPCFLETVIARELPIST